MLAEIPNQLQYAVKVNGHTVKVLPSRQLAEAAILSLPPDQQRIAEILPIQQNTGKELLLG